MKKNDCNVFGFSKVQLFYMMCLHGVFLINIKIKVFKTRTDFGGQNNQTKETYQLQSFGSRGGLRFLHRVWKLNNQF